MTVSCRMFARCTPSFMLALVIVVGCRPDEADAGPRIAIDACATNETEDCELNAAGMASSPHA